MISRLKMRVPDARDDALLQEMIDSAEGMILAYTGRDEVPEVLEGAQVEIAAMLFNRMGMEGESAHAEGSVSRSADSLPDYVRRQLNPYRVARAVGMCE